MAHADYHCCALCDKKLEYANGGYLSARTKEDLCINCQKTLHNHSVMAYNGSELAEWIEEQDKESVAELFLEAGYRMCHYENPVDKAFCEKTGIEREYGYYITEDDLSHLF